MSEINKTQKSAVEQPSNLFEEKTIRTEPIFQGHIISLQIDHVTLPNGATATREIVRHPGAVAVLPIRGDKMIVVEQYRKPLGKSQIEIPAGKLDAGEEPLEAAKRELLEETGYTSPSLRHVTSFYTSPGFADELIHLYVADELVSGPSNPDEDEFLEVSEVTLQEAKELIRSGKISDAKTILAIYAWQLHTLTGSYE